MLKLVDVRVTSDVLEYLQKRQLLRQFQKAKKFLLGGHSEQVDLKKRKPKTGNAWYFRVNRQFRAVGRIESDVLYVDYIDNHQ